MEILRPKLIFLEFGMNYWITFWNKKPKISSLKQIPVIKNYFNNSSMIKNLTLLLKNSEQLHKNFKLINFSVTKIVKICLNKVFKEFLSNLRTFDRINNSSKFFRNQSS